MKTTKSAKIIFLLLTLLIITAIGAFPAYAKTAKKTISYKKLNSGKQFTMVDMPYHGAYSPIKTYKGHPIAISQIQNFDYTPDGKYIINIGDCKINDKNYSLLTRCTLPKKRGPKATATCVDALVLGRFGHSEVVCVTQDDLSKEIYNLWIAANPGSDGYGREIARLTYKVARSGKGRITKKVYLKGFEKSNVENGKPAYYKNKPSVEWMNCSVDTKNNQIMFRMRFPSGMGCYYVSYDYKKINSALNKLGNNKKYNISKAAKWQRAIIHCSLRPLDTLQSFAVSGNKLILCGGHRDIGAQINIIKFKLLKDGNTTIQEKTETTDINTIINITPKLRVNGRTFKKSDIEIEGMKVIPRKNGKLDYHLSFNILNLGLRDTITIWKFTQ